jgi:hypothetical protein
MTGTVQYLRPVVFVGENPNLTLYRQAGGAPAVMVAAASFWRCSWSPAGTGSVLVVWTDPEASGHGERAPRAVWADNEPLGRLVAGRFVRHFAEFRGTGIAETAPRPADFAARSGHDGSLRVTGAAGGRQIELAWSAAEDPYLRAAEEPYGDVAYHVSSVLRPCGQADIAVDGRRLPGWPLRSELDGQPHSSAFLAYSETWVQRGAG